MKKKILMMMLTVTLALSTGTIAFADTYSVTKDSVNVRSEANTDAEVLGKLTSGDSVDVKEVSDGWAKIDYNGTEAYVSADFIEKTETEDAKTEETVLDFVDESDGSLFKGMTLKAEQVKEVYETIEASFTDPEFLAIEWDDFEKQDAFTEAVEQKLADKFGFTIQQIDNIYFYAISYGIPTAGTTAPAKTFKMKFGDFVDSNVNGDTIVIKAKIGPSYSNQATIDQNYYNVCEVIRNGGDTYNEIQYWAVADMTDGSEAKVISFTVPKDVIDYIANNKFPDNTLGDYVEDLWILPSLLK